MSRDLLKSLSLFLIIVILLSSGLMGCGGSKSSEKVLTIAYDKDAAVTARMVRSSMLEVMGEDYIRTARAKGFSEKVVMNKHALKNALISIITLLGMRIGWILGGSAILETVFSIPGLGRLMIDGIFSRDYPVVQGSMLILGASVLFGNLIADILYAVVDPRIKY